MTLSLAWRDNHTAFGSVKGRRLVPNVWLNDVNIESSFLYIYEGVWVYT